MSASSRVLKMATPKMIPLLPIILFFVAISSVPGARTAWEPHVCPANQSACYTMDEGIAFGCYDMKNDPRHCGNCFGSCPGLAFNSYGTCSNYRCNCKPGYAYCNYWRSIGADNQILNICVNFTSDSDNCGKCDNPCPRYGPCSNGRCFPCPEGYTECQDTDGVDRYCTRLSGDTLNCGACGNWCLPDSHCQNGTCAKGSNPPPSSPPPPPLYTPPTSWVRSLIPTSGVTFFSPLTTFFTSNGGSSLSVTTVNRRPDLPTGSAKGYGPCPYWTKSGVKPAYTLPVTDIITLATSKVSQATSIYTSSIVNLTRANSAGMASFGAEFFFQLTPDGCIEDGFSPNAEDTDTCGSGFVFTIQSQGRNSVGYSGPDIGYGKLTAPLGYGVAAVKKSVAVEFDLKISTRMLDGDGNHIAVDVDGSPRHNLTDTKSYVRITQNLADGNIKHVAIVYDANAKLLLVYFADDPTSAPRLLISYPLDVRKYVDVSRSYLGFTAATGITPNLMNLKVYNLRLFFASSNVNPTPLSPPSPTRCPPPPSSGPGPSPSPAKAPAPAPRSKTPSPAPTPAPKK